MIDADTHGLALVALVAVVAITAAVWPSAAQLRERERCYEAAEAAAQMRVDHKCPGRLASCLTARAIIADLRRAQEKCP